MLRKCFLRCVASTPYTYQEVKGEKDPLSLLSPSKAKGNFVLPGSSIFNPPDGIKVGNVTLSHFKCWKMVFQHLSGLKKLKSAFFMTRPECQFQWEGSDSNMFLEAVVIFKLNL